MSWEWVVLILGVLFIFLAFSIASMYARRETFEHREGQMFAPTVTRRTGHALFAEEQEQKELEPEPLQDTERTET